MAGHTLVPAAVARDARGAIVEGASLTWTSSNTEVLAVSGGRAVGVRHGNVTLKVSSGAVGQRGVLCAERRPSGRSVLRTDGGGRTPGEALRFCLGQRSERALRGSVHTDSDVPAVVVRRRRDRGDRPGSPFGSGVASCQLAERTEDVQRSLRAQVRGWNRASAAREDGQFTVLVLE